MKTLIKKRDAAEKHPKEIKAKREGYMTHTYAQAVAAIVSQHITAVPLGVLSSKQNEGLRKLAGERQSTVKKLINQALDEFLDREFSSTKPGAEQPSERTVRVPLYR
jgi:hypothetical protein